MLFSGPMASANVAGLKTVTRRVIDGRVKHGITVSQPTFLPGAGKEGDMWSFIEWDTHGEPAHWIESDFGKIRERLIQLCPYGEPGDLLWQRETLRSRDDGSWYYAADESPVLVDEKDQGAMLVWAHHNEKDVCSSIHMPRWASRFNGQRTDDIRVERLQDITEEDAIAEGIDSPTWDDAHAWDTPTTLSPYFDQSGGRKVFETARDCYADFWDYLNGQKKGFAWKDNPWVYRVAYKGVPNG